MRVTQRVLIQCLGSGGPGQGQALSKREWCGISGQVWELGRRPGTGDQAAITHGPPHICKAWKDMRSSRHGVPRTDQGL